METSHFSSTGFHVFKVILHFTLLRTLWELVLPFLWCALACILWNISGYTAFFLHINMIPTVNCRCLGPSWSVGPRLIRWAPVDRLGPSWLAGPWSISWPWLISWAPVDWLGLGWSVGPIWSVGPWLIMISWALFVFRTQPVVAPLVIRALFAYLWSFCS